MSTAQVASCAMPRFANSPASFALTIYLLLTTRACCPPASSDTAAVRVPSRFPRPIPPPRNSSTAKSKCYSPSRFPPIRMSGKPSSIPDASSASASASISERLQVSTHMNSLPKSSPAATLASAIFASISSPISSPWSSGSATSPCRPTSIAPTRRSIASSTRPFTPNH